MFGVRKIAARTSAALAQANHEASPWTQSPDRHEFFVRYFADVGYVITSWDRGLVVLAKQAKQIATAAEEIASSVAAKAQDWETGTTGRRNAPSQAAPDPRRSRN